MIYIHVCKCIYLVYLCTIVNITMFFIKGLVRNFILYWYLRLSKKRLPNHTKTLSARRFQTLFVYTCMYMHQVYVALHTLIWFSPIFPCARWTLPEGVPVVSQHIFILSVQKSLLCKNGYNGYLYLFMKKLSVLKAEPAIPFFSLSLALYELLFY